MAQLVKTVNSLAIASVKTCEGLAIASVKTIDGIDNTSSASPMTTPILAAAGGGSSITASATEYCQFQSRNFNGSGLANSNTPIGVAGTVSNLYVAFDAAPTAGKSFAFTLYKNSVATGLTCTIADAAITANDTTHSVTVAIGDLLAWEILPTGTPTIPTNIQLSCVFVSDNANESVIFAGDSQTAPSTSVAAYASISSRNVWSGTEDIVSTIVSPPGVIDKLYVSLSGAPGTAASGKSYTFTLYKNGAPTALTCVVLDTATTANDTSHTVTVAAGDTISIECVPANTPTSRNANAGMRFAPTTNGESMVAASMAAPSTTATRWFTLHDAQGNGFNANTATTASLAPIAFTLTNLYTSISTAPGTAASRTSRSYLNGAYGALSAAMSGAASTSASDTSNSDGITQGDTVFFATDPAVVPAVVTWYKVGATAYITP